MNNEEIKKEVLKFGWERWIERPFGPFMLCLMAAATTKESMKSIGIDTQMPAILFQSGSVYTSHDVMKIFDSGVMNWMKKGHTIFDVSLECQKFYKESKKEIGKLILSKRKPQEKFDELYKILGKNFAFIWLAHAFEDIYTPKIKEAASKIVGEEELDKYIGDLSYPIKKNAHSLMEEAILKGESAEKIAKDFGWIRVRDGFSDPFSVEEMEEQIKKIKENPSKVHQTITPPKDIKKLVDEVRELVWYRTYRSDIFYELLFMSRPILREIADLYKIDFKDLKYYSILDLVKGKPKRYNYDINAAYYNGEIAFFNEPIIIENKKQSSEVKGVTAYKGKIQGIAKIVNTVADLDKVKKGNILVAPMTFPSFIMAMNRASAFVTNEGGITCHAAIVSREMHKPCIVGTRNATKVLKDGDLVEVDADKGIVRIIKKA